MKSPARAVVANSEIANVTIVVKERAKKDSNGEDVATTSPTVSNLPSYSRILENERETLEQR